MTTYYQWFTESGKKLVFMGMNHRHANDRGQPSGAALCDRLAAGGPPIFRGQCELNASRGPASILKPTGRNEHHGNTI
jgi:hypothetical protein